jgi:hypothetical protein
MIVTLCNNHIPLRSDFPNLFLLSFNKFFQNPYPFSSLVLTIKVLLVLLNLFNLFLQLKQGNVMGMFIISFPPNSDFYIFILFFLHF